MSETGSETGTRRARLRVSGRVQGVCYRASTQERARALGLSGWVRNAPDGAVEIDAQGQAAQLDALIAWCHQGPPAARVDDVQVEWVAPHEEAQADRDEFRIR